jgi:adenylate cyclase
MRIGIRVAISGLVLAAIIVSAAGVHLLWWRTAERTSRTLADTINQQIVSAVGDELQSVTSEARSANTAIRTLFQGGVIDLRDADRRKFAFLSQLQSQPTISWVAFGWPDGSFAAVHKLGDDGIETMEIAGGESRLEIVQYDLSDIALKMTGRRTVETAFKVTAQTWFRQAMTSDGGQWFNPAIFPGTPRPAVSFSGPIDIAGKRQGVLSIGIELTRVSRFLSQLTVGKSAGAFILDRDGNAIAAPDPDADELNPLKTNHPLFPVAVDAIRNTRASYNPDSGDLFRTRVKFGGEAYEAVLTPISFPGWSLVTVVPESEFLGPVQMTIRRLLLGLAVLIVVAGLLSVWFARRLIAAPLLRVINEIRHVERFDLDKVQRHRSRLTEIENLSAAIGDMAQGLAAFKKYIPADLVRRLIGEGNAAQLGGTVRPMTVMFIDMAGFTGLSERLGDRIIPILSRYFDSASGQIQEHGGTIDKFIGDAVMAFWGAPAVNPDHAADCCRAALACHRAVAALNLVDDAGTPLKIRIGINSGDMLVGNIGSEVRLNYTVIGDAVNIASRLEGTNKVYGSDIIIGPETRRLAGDGIVVRELDRLAVYGRGGGLAIYELVGMSEAEREDAAAWIVPYEQGLGAYRAQDFASAIAQFEAVLRSRPGDGPATLMIDRCRGFIASPPAAGWNAVSVAGLK